VGGTTLAVALQRAALHWNVSVNIPIPRMDKETCGRPHDGAMQAWTRMLRRNPGGLHVFASQVCLHSFMLRPHYWANNQRPVLLGLVRDAWSRWLSAWRYLEKRCEEHDPEMCAARYTCADTKKKAAGHCELVQDAAADGL